MRLGLGLGLGRTQGRGTTLLITRWLLATSSWSDAGIWINAANWSD